MWNLLQHLLVTVLIVNTQGFLFSFIKPKSECFDIYGEKTCFSTAKPFTNTARKLPESPALQKVSFALYTPGNPDNPQELTGSNPTSAVGSSNLNSAKMTRVIIHGFNDDGNKAWVKAMKTELLNNDGSNVLVVDWEHGADKSFLEYPQAAANTRVVGALLAKMIKIISSKKNVNPSSFHLIGHSLGAHIAGYAGRRLSGEVGRISGLDPAGPAFEKYDAKVRLDKSDAKFVDVIHTNGKELILGGFGVTKDTGDADFYPNGGLSQPGCPSTILSHIVGLFLNGPNSLKSSVSCDHLRVLPLFTESINTACTFRACGQSGCSRMGFHADKTKIGRFNLNTNSASKFCIE